MVYTPDGVVPDPLTLLPELSYTETDPLLIAKFVEASVNVPVMVPPFANAKLIVVVLPTVTLTAVPLVIAQFNAHEMPAYNWSR
jgi:hypothetical protein